MANPLPADDRKELRDYAWKYFDRHAEQRLKTFNFYLLLCGGFIAGIVTVLGRQEFGAAGALAILFSFVSFVFCKLEVRNRHLTKHSEEALKTLEDELSLPDEPGGMPHRCKLFRREEAEMSKKRRFPRGTYFSYTTCFKLIFGVFGWGSAMLGLMWLYHWWAASPEVVLPG